MRHAALALFTVLAIPAVLSCDGSPTTSRQDDGPFGDVTIRRTGTANATAKGVLRYTFGATTAELSFIVSNNSSSVTTGKALYFSSAAGVVMVINVTCLNVTGTTTKTGTFLGTVLESNDASIEGKDASWQVVDGSTDSASLINLADAGTGPSCTTPGEFDLVTVSAGLLQLTN